jgi:hypothetical protein
VIARGFFSALGRIHLSIARPYRSQGLGNVQVVAAADAPGKIYRHLFQTPPGICIDSQRRLWEMQKVSEYEECRQKAAQTTDLQLKKQLEEMAKVWDRLARERRQGIVENNPNQT